MDIRKANNDDVDLGLLELYAEGYIYHRAGRPDIFPDKDKNILKIELLKAIEEEKVLLVGKDNLILGYILYQIKEKHPEIMWVDQLVIRDDSRNRGLGKVLLNEVKKQAKEKNCKRLELSCWSFNTNAINIYEHLGLGIQRYIFELNLD